VEVQEQQLEEDFQVHIVYTHSQHNLLDHSNQNDCHTEYIMRYIVCLDYQVSNIHCNFHNCFDFHYTTRTVNKFCNQRNSNNYLSKLAMWSVAG